MKIRKKYSIVVNRNNNTGTITKYNSFYSRRMEDMIGIRVYDCTFDEAVHNLKYMSNNGFFIHKRG